ncbi:MAG: 4-alpha-glucanotransferase [Pseudomonadota bacterium]|nr:4-alpha-glucanotransferase [Pseudomonadota bacterium]
MTSASGVLDRRRAGILLHPSSLPGTDGDGGDFGHEAYRFVEFLHASGITLWQVLPLGPTHRDRSPYQCLSVHAGNPAFISVDWLRDRGFLEGFVHESANSDTTTARPAALRHAGKRFRASPKGALYAEFTSFVSTEAGWLEDFALYVALRRHCGNCEWWNWPPELRDRSPEALRLARQQHAGEITQVRFEQFVFFTQWRELKAYAQRHDVRMFGDMPIFVAHDSADVWAHRGLFTVDAAGRPEKVAGVPPDYFSQTGQRWGNPLYRWDAMEADGFRWWRERLSTQLKLFDIIRLDHFRGLEAFWEIDADEDTAINGTWVPAPGEALLKALTDAFPDLPLVAEDLGTITPDVVALRRRFGIPGMKILQFGFDGQTDNPYLPHNTSSHSVVYTGTHDNDTVLGWYASLEDRVRWEVSSYLGFPGEPMPWPLVRAALASRARFAVVPMQDVLGLGSDARMNTPGVTVDNWGWRVDKALLSDALTARLREACRLYGRL